MSIVTKILNAVSKEELQGISLGEKTRWEVEAVQQPSLFFRNLHFVLPPDSVLYFEGASIADEIQTFLRNHLVNKPCPVQGGTIWPRPMKFHVQFASSDAENLASLSERYATPEICDHFHCYKNEKVVLQWFDAWDEPIGLSADISETSVIEFCKACGVKYKLYEAVALK